MDLVCYDGHCGLCHGTVQFLLKRDRDGSRFAFAPLQGETVRARLGAEGMGGLPDSVAVIREDGTVLVKSRAVAHLLRRLGGAWGLLGRAMGGCPQGLGDWAYDQVAARRRRWFKAPEGLCPRVPPEWGRRFRP